jgi:nitroreductase
MLKDLVLQCRSYRRFYEDVAMDMNTLRELVDIARCVASATNRQPLKYILSCSRERNNQIFSCLHWAAMLKTWKGPQVGERPSAYIIILGDKEVIPSFGVDHGIAAQTILLGAVEKGFGGCMLAAVDRDELRTFLNIPSKYDILLVIALGKPREKVVIDELLPGEDSVYWRDKEDVHHVPKRRLVDIIVAEYQKG